MLAFNDQIGAVDGRSTERMNFRTKPHIKQTIQRAAALASVDDSVFTMSAAYQSALETIEAHERTILAHRAMRRSSPPWRRPRHPLIGSGRPSLVTARRSPVGERRRRTSRRRQSGQTRIGIGLAAS